MSTSPAYASIERTLSVLLSPLDHPTWQSWQRAAHAQLLDLTHADSLCIYTPLAPGADAWYAPHVSRDVLATYAAQVAEQPDWDVIESGFISYSSATGRSVAHESDFLTTPDRERSAFHHEFLAPHRLHDLTIAGANFGGVDAARLHFGNRAWRSESERVERQHLVRSVLPAFKAGLTMWRQLGQRKAELGYVFDALTEAVMLFDDRGALVHANPSARQLVTPAMSSPLDAERVRQEAAQVARHVNALLVHAGVGAPTVTPSAATRDLRLPGMTITLRGALAPSWMFGRSHGVIVTLERTVATALSDEELRTHFGLTSREVEVARALADGLSNQALAERFGVSFFTARNHVERILTKLGATSRAHVGAILRAPLAQRAA